MLNIKQTLAASAAVFAMSLTGSALAAYGLPEGPAVAPAAVVVPTETPAQGWYLGLLGGVDFFQNLDTRYPKDSDDIMVVSSRRNVKFQTGWLAGTHLGYRDGQMRYEIEYLYQQADLKKHGHRDDSVTVITPASMNGDGDRHHRNRSAQINAGMVNGIYDIMEPGSTFNPYIKVGIGYANVHVKTRGYAYILPSSDEVLYRSGKVSEGVFAYQAGVGVGFQATDNAVLSLGYTYFGTTNIKKHTVNDSISNNIIYLSGDFYL